MTKSFDKQKVLKELSDKQIVATKKSFSGSPSEDKNVAEDFEEKRKQINKAETAVVYLASEWPAEYVDKLVDLVTKLLKREVFVDIRIDPALVAGGAVSIKGKYWDFSLRQQFLEKKEELKKIYAKFL